MAKSQRLSLQDSLVGNKYRIGSVIGSGGVATVYRATHIWTEREVAVKVLDPTLPHFGQLREAFLREARATVQLDHPNVVDVLDMGDDDWETAYMVMELLHGPTLRDVLLDRGRLTEEETLAVLLPLIDALEKAHELGIVHRDFKPENIILSVDANNAVTPKLLDFGVAEVVENVRSRSLASAGDVIVGTPQYMSPEQARDERELIGPHTDVWGIGVVWYECLAGRSPFDGDNAAAILRAVCERPIDFEGIPDIYVPLLTDALKRSPAERIGTLSELKARFEELGIPTTWTPAPRASEPALPSSVPPPRVRESYVRRTQPGIGREELPWTAQRARRRERPRVLPERARRKQIDSDFVRVPRRRKRKAMIRGVAFITFVVLAAWWTIADWMQDAPTPEEPVAAEESLGAEPVEQPVITEEFLRELLAAEKLVQELTEVEEPVAEEPVVTEAEATKTPAAQDAATKPEPKPSKPARRKTTSERPRPPSPSGSSQYRKPPDLVTEW